VAELPLQDTLQLKRRKENTLNLKTSAFVSVLKTFLFNISRQKVTIRTMDQHANLGIPKSHTVNQVEKITVRNGVENLFNGAMSIQNV
jgi:hypothetical protein